MKYTVNILGEDDMQEKDNWFWVETIFQRIPLPYPIVCLIIGVLIYLIYIFFSIKIGVYPLPFYAQLSAVSMSIIIAFMLGGIQYLLDILKTIISYWDALFAEPENDIYSNAGRRFIESYWHYALIFSVIIPFYLIDWMPPLKQSFFAHFMEMYLPIYSMPDFHTAWGLIFDIYIQILGLFALFLLSGILWIMFNITWTLRDSRSASCSLPPTACVFNTKMRIASIKNLILKVLLYYFTCISLAVISYFNPAVFFSKETGLLLILLLIGILFFFLGLDAIQRTFKNQVEHELDEINKRNQGYVQRLKTITFADSHNGTDDINHISNVLDVFQKQREQLEQINTNVYDVHSNVRFISTLLLPFITRIFMGALDNSIIKSAVISQELSSRINETIIMILNNKIL